MKNKYKWVLILLILIPLLYTLVLYYNNRLEKTDSLKIIYIPKSSEKDDVFWRSVSTGAKLAASEYDAELSIRAPKEEENYIEQNEIIYQAIEEKPDAIVLAAADHLKTLGAAKTIVENGIILVLVDSIVDEEVANAVIATDNYQAGIRMGAAMKGYIEDHEQVGIINHVAGTSTAIDREDGIRMGLTDDKEKIVATYYSNSDIDLAETLTKEMLNEYPDITVIAALNQHASVGVGRAIKSLGLENKVTIFGFDNAKEGIKNLEEGIFQALLVQKPFNMGYLGVETAIKLATGKNTETKINTGSALITRENMYTRLNQKLLFPFMEE